MAANAERQVLIAGGAGYVGSVMTRGMLDAGFRVRVLDSFLYDNAGSLADLSGDPGFSLIEADIRRRDDVDAALEGVSDVVLLASLVGDPVCKKNPELARATNLDGARTLLAASESADAERFVFASTCSNYGLRPDAKPATEEDELHPLSLYAETKVEMEGEVASAASVIPTVLRVSTAYGLSPRMRFDLTVSEFTRELALSNQLEVYDPDTWRPYAHVADIASAVIAVLGAAEDEVGGEVFNVGGDDSNHTKRMIVEAVLEALDGDGDVIWTQGGSDPRNYRVSFDKIRERLGFTPEWTVPKAIDELVGALRDGRFTDVEERPLFYRNFELESAPVGEAAGDGG